MKFGDLLTSLLMIKYTKCYLGSFRFDNFILQCLGVYFFPNMV